MRKVLVLLLVGLGVSCLPLEPLCASDHFDYLGARVNAIYRAQINVTLEPVSHFSISSLDDCSNLKWRFSHFKLYAKNTTDKYNRLVIRVYSELFLNSNGLNRSVLRKELYDIDGWISAISRLTYSNGELTPVSNCLKANFIPPLKRGAELIRRLESLYVDCKLPQKDEQALKLDKREMFKKFQDEIARMANNVTESQTMAFRLELITELYRKPIAKMGKFVFHRKSELFYDLNSDGTLNFELIFPFEDTHLQAGKDCVSSDSLPKFYKSKDFRLEPKPL